MVGSRWLVAGAVALAGLNGAVAEEPRRERVAIVHDPVACLELNASGTIVYNHCEEFIRFGWRNRSNCAAGCAVEVAPGGLAVVGGLGAFHVYGACRGDDRLAWLGWRYSCYPQRR